MRRVLGVRAVLRATVMQGADKLDISAELVDARDGSHIWGIYSEMTLRLARFQLQRSLSRSRERILQWLVDRLRSITDGVNKFPPVAPKLCVAVGSSCNTFYAQQTKQL